ncbi:MAG: Gx transporter family protein [Bacillota bacterium]|nr:Gx transporter family protein [Bacillota bacterium]
MLSVSKRLARGGLLVALAAIFSYLEALFPLPLGIPGLKLGLANVVIVFALYCYGWRTAFWVSLCRILLVSFLFANLAMAMYSLAGALFSLLVMALLRSCRCFSLWGVSMAGGVTHNLAQLLLASLLAGTKTIWAYGALLVPVGVLTGLLIALLFARSRRALVFLWAAPAAEPDLDQGRKILQEKKH